MISHASQITVKFRRRKDEQIKAVTSNYDLTLFSHYLSTSEYIVHWLSLYDISLIHTVDT